MKDPLFVNLTIPVAKGSKEPILRQIYSAIRQSILNGTLRSGDALPSTRELADQLGVSRTTTVAAYEQLLAEGFTVSSQGARTVVAKGVQRKVRKTAAVRPLQPAKIELSRFGEAAAKAGVDFPTRNKGKVLRYDFVYGRSAVEVFPFETWNRMLLQRARKASLRTLDYGPATGNELLREAIASHLRRSRAVVCDASQVIVVNGSQQALDLAARVFLEPGDQIAIEDPQYQGAREAFRAAGAKLIHVPVDSDGLRTNLLPDGAKMLFTTPSHQFPVGSVLSLTRRMQVLDWARRENAVIVEDDYDGEFHYEGQPVESMQGLDAEGRVLYIGTFSRTIFPALRIGYMIVPKPLAAAFAAAKWICDRHTATLEQETLAEFISSGAYEGHLRKVRKRNASRRQALLESIGECLGESVDVTGEKSGTHLVIWPRRDIQEETIIRRAAANDVGVYGVRPYYMYTVTRSGIILGFSRMHENDIREGIRRLAQCGVQAPNAHSSSRRYSR